MEIFKQNITSASPWKTAIGTLDGKTLSFPRQTSTNDHSIDYENGIVTVVLTKGYSATVNLDEWSWMRFLKWFALVSKTMSGNVYMASSAKIGKGKRIVLLAHRMIAGGVLPDGKKTGMVVDHLDTNSLNNCRENLAVRSRLANSHNRSKANRNSSTGERNIYPYGDKFKVSVRIDRNHFYWVGFRTLKSAVAFRDQIVPRLRSSIIKGGV